MNSYIPAWKLEWGSSTFHRNICLWPCHSGYKSSLVPLWEHALLAWWALHSYPGELIFFVSALLLAKESLPFLNITRFCYSFFKFRVKLKVKKIVVLLYDLWCAHLASWNLHPPEFPSSMFLVMVGYKGESLAKMEKWKEWQLFCSTYIPFSQLFNKAPI